MHCKTVGLLCLFGVQALAGLSSCLVASPDPDIFDGSVAQTSESTASSSGAQSSETALDQTGSGSAAGGGASEPRDLESIGGIRGGQTISQPSTDSGANSAGSKASASTPSGGSSASSSSGGTPTEGASGERNFEDFGFGETGANEANGVSVNTSKAQPPSRDASSTETSASSASASAEPTNEASGSGGSGSKRANSNAKGDYGSNIPSGI